MKSTAFILLRDNLCVPFHSHQTGPPDTGGVLLMNTRLVLVPGKKIVLDIIKHFLPLLRAGPKSKLCHDLIHYLIIFNALALTEK